MTNHDKKMDSRCPRQLQSTPETWCPLAVMRLKAIRNAGRELTEAEEEKLPGCAWACAHQLSNYCFFKFMQDYGDGISLLESEIASSLYLPPETVKKVEKTAIAKLRNQSAFVEIKDLLDTGESVLTERDADDEISVFL